MHRKDLLESKALPFPERDVAGDPTENPAAF
jgi:hypothetical protein